MTIEIPDEIMRHINLSKKDLLVETACLIFEHGKISVGNAAKIAKMDKSSFYEELKKRKISWIADDADLQEEFDLIKKPGFHDRN